MYFIILCILATDSIATDSIAKRHFDALTKGMKKISPDPQTIRYYYDFK